jgi:hypothetical protein
MNIEYLGESKSKHIRDGYTTYASPVALGISAID